jgi:hypothetical protein
MNDEMERDIARWKKEYPNLDDLMIQAILGLTEDQHLKLHKGLDNPTYPEINRDELIIKTGEVLN